MIGLLLSHGLNYDIFSRNRAHLREHTRLGARASRPRRIYESKMPSLPGDM